MRNSGLKVFLALLVCTAYLTGFSYTGQAVWDYFSNGDRFEPNTKIASIDISGLPAREAEQKVEDSIKEWQASSPVEFMFRDQEAVLPAEAIRFKVTESIREAEDGQSSPLLVSIDSMLADRVMLDLALDESERIDMDHVKKQISESAAVLAAGQEYDLESYVAGEDQLISEQSLVIPAGDPEISKFVELHPSIKMEPLSQWSLLEQFPEATSQDSLSMIASAIYKAVLSTNLSIVERHTGMTVPEYTEPGFEAKAVPQEMDLKIFNPNHTAYTLSFELSGESLIVRVTGKPLLNMYKAVIDQPEYFSFKQIIRYNAALSVGEERRIREGTDGLFVKVTRSVTDLQGNEKESEEISEDFYPPIHEIIEKRYEEPVEPQDEVLTDLPEEEQELPSIPEDPAVPSEGEEELPAESGETAEGEEKPLEETETVPAEDSAEADEASEQEAEEPIEK
ncbi:VanW family protein [Metabacillus sp. 113a]|uniref:VanW family protein n=1 Tax=Metabacillus sp. 113a TaxID=3404706 RepID=UPI003CE8915A